MRFISNLAGIITGRDFHIIFKNRETAGNILASSLKAKLKGIDANKTLVLGMNHGGMIVADAVSAKLAAALDVVIVRQLKSPFKENCIGAMLADGFTYLDEAQVSLLKASPEHIENERREQGNEIRKITSRIESIGPSRVPPIENQTVILVDDVFVTPPTVIAAARWIRKRKPREFVIAAPVATNEAIESIKKECDLIHTITTLPYQGKIGDYYNNFDDVTDEELLKVLQRWHGVVS